MNPTTVFIGRRVPGRWFAMVTVLVIGLATVQPTAAFADSPQPDGPPDKGRHSWCYKSGFRQQDRYVAILDMGAINNAARPNEQRRKTACHELGHTVGVRHYWNGDLPGNDRRHSCLRSGEVRASWTGLRRYGHHHRTQHINPWFG